MSKSNDRTHPTALVPRPLERPVGLLGQGENAGVAWLFLFAPQFGAIRGVLLLRLTDLGGGVEKMALGCSLLACKHPAQYGLILLRLLPPRYILIAASLASRVYINPDLPLAGSVARSALSPVGFPSILTNAVDILPM